MFHKSIVEVYAFGLFGIKANGNSGNGLPYLKNTVYKKRKEQYNELLHQYIELFVQTCYLQFKMRKPSIRPSF